MLLGCAKLAAELMQKIGQPSILGEISVGIFLGPTVLGRFRPHIYQALFPTTGPMPIVLDTVTTLGVVEQKLAVYVPQAPLVHTSMSYRETNPPAVKRSPYGEAGASQLEK